MKGERVDWPHVFQFARGSYRTGDFGGDHELTQALLADLGIDWDTAMSEEFQADWVKGRYRQQEDVLEACIVTASSSAGAESAATKRFEEWAREDRGLTVRWVECTRV
jgi:hypothetical protein